MKANKLTVKLFKHPQIKKGLKKIASHFQLMGGQIDQRRPVAIATIRAMADGRLTVRDQDGKPIKIPQEGDMMQTLYAISKSQNLPGRHPHQYRITAVAALRAITDGDLDVSNDQGKGFWQDKYDNSNL